MRTELLPRVMYREDDPALGPLAPSPFTPRMGCESPVDNLDQCAEVQVQTRNFFLRTGEPVVEPRNVGIDQLRKGPVRCLPRVLGPRIRRKSPARADKFREDPRQFGMTEQTDTSRSQDRRQFLLQHLGAIEQFEHVIHGTNAARMTQYRLDPVANARPKQAELYGKTYKRLLVVYSRKFLQQLWFNGGAVDPAEAALRPQDLALDGVVLPDQPKPLESCPPILSEFLARWQLWRTRLV